MNTPTPHRRPIGQILIAQGVISEDQLRIALLEQMKSNQPVGKLLVSLGFVSEATLRDALSESLGQRSVDLVAQRVELEAADRGAEHPGHVHRDAAAAARAGGVGGVRLGA